MSIQSARMWKMKPVSELACQLYEMIIYGLVLAWNAAWLITAQVCERFRIRAW